MICHILRDDEQEALCEKYPLYDPTRENTKTMFDIERTFECTYGALESQVNIISLGHSILAGGKLDASTHKEVFTAALGKAHSYIATLSQVADAIAEQRQGGTLLTGIQRTETSLRYSVDELSKGIHDWGSKLKKSSVWDRIRDSWSSIRTPRWQENQGSTLLSARKQSTKVSKTF